MNRKATACQDMQSLFAHEIFELQVQRTPNRIAVKYTDFALTYAELNCVANRLASRLRQLGVGSDSIVGVCVERGLGLLVGLLGVLKSGGAYLPLDPAYPALRLEFLIRDSAPTVIVVDAQTGLTIGDTAAFVVSLDALSSELSENLSTLGSPESLAYVLYTSGSTGSPKGVAGPHRGLANRVVWGQTISLFTSDARYLHTTSAGFLDSVTASLGALAVGSCVHIATNDEMRNVTRMRNAILDSAITHLVLVPAVIRALVNYGGPCLSSLSLVVSSGQRLDEHLADAAASAWPSVTLINLYGCSEVAGDSTWHVVFSPNAAPTTALIGKPISNTEIYLLDENLNCVRQGSVGEIYIAGDGLARGYLNRPELTDERFLPNVFGAPHARMYKTGDLAFQLPDGALKFVGRIDDQIKIRGFRVEPSEIESALLDHAAVSEAVVVAVETGLGAHQLAACLVLKPLQTVSFKDLQIHLRRLLPEYMVPTRSKFLGSLPVNAHGKLDRSAVSALMKAAECPLTGAAAPRSKLQEQLVQVWAEVLGVQSVGIDDNLFDIGVHSLNIVEARLRLESTLRLPVSIDVLYGAKSIAAQAQRIEATLLGQTERTRDAGVAGNYPLTPAQARFFESEPPSQQSINILELMVSTERTIMHMTKAINSVMSRHDTFHTVAFPVINGSQCLQMGEEPNFTLVYFGSASSPQELARMCGDARRELDISSKKYCCWTIGQMSNRTYAYFACHHLLCDAISINVLYWELKAILEGSEEHLSKPGTLRRWLATYVTEESLSEFDTELPYWEDVVAKRTEATETLSENGGHQESETWIFRVPPERDLDRTTILGCLLHAFARTFGWEVVPCRIVDSGRGIHSSLDDSLTVGWLAQHIPFRFKTSKCLPETIDMTEAALSRVRRRGTGYGWLRYYSQAAVLMGASQLTEFPLYFNHLYSDSLTSSNDLRNEKALLEQCQNGADLCISGVAVLAFQSSSLITFNVLYAKEYVESRIVKELLRYLEECLGEIGSLRHPPLIS